MSNAQANRDKYAYIVDRLEEFLDSTRRYETVQRLAEQLRTEKYPQLFPPMDGSADCISSGEIMQCYQEKYAALQSRTKQKLDYMDSYVAPALSKLDAARQKVAHYQSVMDAEAAEAAAAAQAAAARKRK